MSQQENIRELPRKFDRERIVRAVREILEAIGDDPSRDGLLRTPERVADMYVEIFAGINKDASKEMDVVFDEGHDEMILIRQIPLYSVCEHHLLPWIGEAHVAYIPNKAGQITGLSKIARVVDTLSKRPQVQERLTTQIADAIEEALDPRGVLVILEAEHLCMTMRGIKKPGAQTVTSAIRGLFRDSEATRSEAMGLIAHRR